MIFQIEHQMNHTVPFQEEKEGNVKEEMYNFEKLKDLLILNKKYSYFYKRSRYEKDIIISKHCYNACFKLWE